MFRLTCCLWSLLIVGSYATSAHSAENDFGDLPEHAVRVFGDDRFVFNAQTARFINEDRIIAFNRNAAAIVDARSGAITELPGMQPKLGFGNAALGGSGWLAAERFHEDQTEISVWSLDELSAPRHIQIDGRIRKHALSHDGESLVIAKTADSNLQILRTADGRRSDQQPAPPGTGEVVDVAFVGNGRALMVVRRTLDKKGYRYQFFNFLVEGGIGFEISSFDVERLYYRVLPSQSDDHVLLLGLNGTIIVHDFDAGHQAAEVKLPVSAMGADLNAEATKLVTCGAFKLIQLWNVAGDTTRPIQEIHAQNRVACVALSPDGKQVASAGGGRINVWDSATGQHLSARERTLTAPSAAIAISPDESKIAVADGMGRAQMWHLESNDLVDLEDRPLPRLGGYDPWPSPQFLAFAPDSKQLLGGSNNAHNVVNLWDAKTGAKIRQYAGHRWPIMGVAWSPDGSLLASTSRDSTLRVFNKAGQVVHTFDDASMAPAFFPDGKRIVAAGKHGQAKGILVFDLDRGVVERELTHAAARGMPWGVAVSPNGKHVATIDARGTVIVWEADTGKVAFDVTPEPVVRSVGGSVAFSNDGKWLAATTMSNDILILNAKTGKQDRMLKGHQAPVRALAFSKNYLASAGVDCRIILWQMSDDAPIGTNQPFTPHELSLANKTASEFAELFRRNDEDALAELLVPKAAIASLLSEEVLADVDAEDMHEKMLKANHVRFQEYRSLFNDLSKASVVTFDPGTVATSDFYAASARVMKNSFVTLAYANRVAVKIKIEEMAFIDGTWYIVELD